MNRLTSPHDAARRALPDAAALAERVVARERSALATALNLLDDKRPEARACAGRLLANLPEDKVYHSGHLIGLTGPPGVGKSSLISALVERWRDQRRTVGILAVDPSSPVSGGALLGDRLRMLSSSTDGGVFIRSLACRGEVGGLSAETWPMSLVMLAASDIVLVETVGVGQKEIDVSKLTDTTCFIAQPASGDTIQFLKAGIMEVPHVLIVNKQDVGLAARKTLTELQASLGRNTHNGDWAVPVLSASATQGTGVAEIVEAVESHRQWLLREGALCSRRRSFQAQWIVKRLREDFGRFGIEALGGERRLMEDLITQGGSPFEHYDRLRDDLVARWS
nr:methylmalonyl Co-A mutase-associated GTPase MeaB [Gammaproteobacteria bacterium]